ncbi:MAG: hypothetical protein CMF59_01515 [Leptospiraceae bacterium]|nr:hypothetical protein [Leptospiraceae bacterium]
MQQEGPSMESLTEKELDVIEVIKLAFQSLKSSWAQSLGVPAVVSLLYGLVSYHYSMETMSIILANPEEGPESMEQLMKTFNFDAWGASLVAGLILYLTMIFPMRSAVRVFGIRSLESSSLGRQALILFLVSVLVTLGSTIGLLFCIIPGMAVFIAFSLAPAVVVLDDAGPGKALSRAYRTFSVRKGKILALILLLGLLTGMFYFITAIPALAYYIFALVDVVMSGEPDRLLGVLQTYVVLLMVGTTLALPVAIGLVGHSLIIAFANFRRFVPAGPEF